MSSVPLRLRYAIPYESVLAATDGPLPSLLSLCARQVVICSSLAELHSYVSPDQLTKDLGGNSGWYVLTRTADPDKFDLSRDSELMHFFHSANVSNQHATVLPLTFAEYLNIDLCELHH